MEAPDRIWLDYGNSHGVFSSRPPDRKSVHYLRATPELLALIEAAKDVGLEPARQARLITAALRYKIKDHPDAG